jgi:hypothetical protein
VERKEKNVCLALLAMLPPPSVSQPPTRREVMCSSYLSVHKLWKASLMATFKCLHNVSSRA